MAITVESAKSALGKVEDPELSRPLVDVGMLGDVNVEGDNVTVGVTLTTPACPYKARIQDDVTAALKAAGAANVTIHWSSNVPERNIMADDPCPGVKNIVLVMSGKGGVGKSTVAANLTLALNRLGCRVGLLDADMYGPSVPTMLGVMGRPTSADGQHFLPLERFGVKLMSIGFLLEDARQAVVWRGPMIQNALLQFMKDVDWGTLDYLILDLPPGTGDIVLTISQKLRTTGAVVVTTPQEVALQDVYKSVSMAQKVGIPILGVVENESYFICDGCSARHELFGSGGGQKIAEFAGAPLLGQIPLDPSVREWGDAGTPVVQAAPDSSVGRAFLEVAQRLAAKVSVHDLGRGGSLRIDRSGGQQRFLPIVR
ncbi:Mrp/NBP35 family ATP-binding protein [Polyangium sp. y55x31]|uniref:Mrp/NBP35 family ATP-binding protein n=1 Tax=Polyangium sp. y55x31 TaxID=3042688 RepID=UPI0024823F62|nr:Mrp/NBP35 family ATP-binding protein [Polyangium sp. y55x31]MDI1481930.1 Mrp/NBP35 family ATP-binding protein [Polyangium sp. y55x31]